VLKIPEILEPASDLYAEPPDRGEGIAELEALLRSERKGGLVVLDLRALTLANQDAITFLERCEAGGITLPATSS
jgi:hypothetical protein